MSDKANISVKMPSMLGTPLFLIFLVLKLTNTIDWSWWWITAPLWIPFCLVMIVFVIVLSLAMIASLLK